VTNTTGILEDDAPSKQQLTGVTVPLAEQVVIDLDVYLPPPKGPYNFESHGERVVVRNDDLLKNV